ncbi:hypothetical protein FHS27_002056 [Rhodopirellula rubra]|uniref:Uncharacterized protein n=1 Tax=Aporhodopirellula rubra TaxID=980271 RepID=A0A7W5DXZ8_9BACT|nr:hypothetical protein [Aporhodopirellula rubra]MBB3206247.1 hypothetical protein [Aporhodopirellula rubra]
MKTSRSNLSLSASQTVGVRPALDASKAIRSSVSRAPRPYRCDTLLWIGDSEHPEMRAVWQVCQQSCDVIAIRRSIDDAIGSPPRHSPTHVIVAQTNRHEVAGFVIDGERSVSLRSKFAEADVLVVRGSLVAPTVRLPNGGGVPNNTACSGHPGSLNEPPMPVWVNSVSVLEAVNYLPHWFDDSTAVDAVGSEERSGVYSGSSDVIVRPVVVVASQYTDAECYLDSLQGLWRCGAHSAPLVQWQRELTRRSSAGFATVLWDDSAAPPTTGDQWVQRCGRAPHARHIWMTGMANRDQRRVARENGIDAVVEKPGRLECLIAAVVQGVH